MNREKFSSRLGFILISAGCAIGLGNVWRFPYIVGKYGGAAFILIYLFFLVAFGLPIMSMEFATGRASGRSIAKSFETLEPKGSKWHLYGIVGTAGNYLLMMFYSTVTGWMVHYFIKMLRGDFFGDVPMEAVTSQFSEMTADPVAAVGFMLLVIVGGALVCSLGLQKGIERITKGMMLALLGIIAVLAVRAVTLPGAAEGLKYYLVPDFGRIAEVGLGEVIFAALGQAFFTLSIGMGAMTIFGSYICRDRALFGECITIASLDTFVALMAGMIIIPSCFAYGISPGEGPGLVFVTLPVVFREMAGGQIWGSFFFLFMIFAAFSTIITVFENILCCCMDYFGWSRKKACLVNCIALCLLSLPCALGFNVLSFIQPLGEGSTILDLEDFIVSNNILPIGSLVYVLFCCLKKGWGWKSFIAEVNTGKGIKLPEKLRLYVTFVIPPIILYILIQGYVSKFFS
ncbi:MAG: sodium-dependent transporter [Clostridia bacterium]|nr:sodium-dependent transporter [Clostridia bacterium]